MVVLPATYFDVSPVQSLDDLHWYAAYTMPRHEKSAVRQLETRSVECFLPMYRVTRHWQHRHTAVELPLFPSYVFARMRRQDRRKVLTAPGILQLVGSKGIPAEIGDVEIEHLRNLLQSRRAYPTNYLAPGNRVRFADGPFVGLEGTIIRYKGQVRLVVSVDMIMRSVLIDVDRSEVELACNSRPESVRWCESDRSLSDPRSTLHGQH